MLVIHELGVHLDRRGKLLVNSDSEQTISSVCAYVEYLSCFPVMQYIFLRFIRSSIFLDPCVP